MEFVADTRPDFSAQYFPTSTPVLDALRPSPRRRRGGWSTAEYFLVSGAVILAFTGLSTLRVLVDSIATQSPVVFLFAFLVLPVFAFLVGLAVHEAGHILAGRMNGFAAVCTKVGPFSLEKRRAYRDFHSDEVLSLGPTILKPVRGGHLRRRLFYVVISGPLASLLLPQFLEGGLDLAPAQWTASHFLPALCIHLISALSLLLGLSSLLPDLDSHGNFSDGARILMLLKDDLRAARWIAILELQLASNRGEHPREWDETRLAQALAVKDESLDTAAACWLAYLSAIHRHDVTLAAKYLEDDLAAPGSLPGNLRNLLFLEAAIFQAWYRHNSLKARFWASHIAKGKALSPLQSLRLEIALLWAEGKPFESWEKLGQYLLQVRQLPASPLRDTAERNGLEWKSQMEPRMLAGAWATMHSWPRELEPKTS